MQSDPIFKLICTTKRIEELSATENWARIAKIREIPTSRMNKVRDVSVGQTTYGNKPDDHPTRLVKEAQEIMAQQEYQRGRDERDEQLRKVASELEQLRAILPSLAAQAAIDIGILSRALKAEADERRE